MKLTLVSFVTHLKNYGPINVIKWRQTFASLHSTNGLELYTNFSRAFIIAFEIVFLSNYVSIFLIVMTMESQAEALGQLTTDDLEGKVSDYLLVI